METKILVTGALGQIGSELTQALRKIYGSDQVVATDIRMPQTDVMREGGPFEFLDVLNPHQITRVMQMYQIKTIYHLASLLSAVGETRPNVAWEINMNGLYNMLEGARQYRCALFFPSSIGAFGPGTPKLQTPQVTVQRPTTMYGITKVSGELLADYYYTRFGVDTRGLRFPGLISHVTEPGGGTTDYAVEMFFEAIKHGNYTCYLRPDTSLDMMYMPDAVRGMIELMEADATPLRHRNAFNVTAMQFTPAQLATALNVWLPDFTMRYEVDPGRQRIADSWPDSIDDSCARKEWGWSPRYLMEDMVHDMFSKVSERFVNSDGALAIKS